jgi:tRNA(Ile)-lysidine synthase
MTLIEAFDAHLASLRLGPGRTVVAVSGGPDSMALLDLLARTAPGHGLELVVGHVDHGIDPKSADVARLVARAAAERALPIESVRLELGASASETEARLARLAALEDIRARVGAGTILLAHHAEDQAETVLMRVLRGSGPAGLAGIPERRGPLVHALLPFRRADLARYVQRQDIAVWQDPANRDARHVRSWLRSELLPLLEARLPGAHGSLVAVAAQARSGRDAWDAVLDVLPGLEPRLEDGGISVAAPVLAGYDSKLGSAIASALGRRVGCTIGPVRSARLLALAASGESGRRVPLGGSWLAEIAFGRLRVVPAERAPAGRVPIAAALGDAASEIAWGQWRFRVRSEAAPARHARRAMTAWFPERPLIVRGPEPGERVAPIGGAGRRLLVRCFQDARVPASKRAGWPVVESEGIAVWVPGVCRSEAMIPPAGSEALRVDVTYD